jgi:hypothetical protein
MLHNQELCVKDALWKEEESMLVPFVQIGVGLPPPSKRRRDPFFKKNKKN